MDRTSLNPVLDMYQLVLIIGTYNIQNNENRYK